MNAPARPCRVGPEAAPAAVAEALRRHIDGCRRQFGLDPHAEHVLGHLLACGTGELGVHDCVCGACGWSGVAGNSCRDRHCPRCQGSATAHWLDARMDRMLPVPHFQVVFTLPAELRPVARANPTVVYDLLFQASTSVLHDLAAQRLGATVGVTAVLHTWTSDLHLHPHLHCLVTAGGLSPDDARWVPAPDTYLFPERVMGRMFRGRFLEGLIDALDAGALHAPGDPGTAERRLRAEIRALSRKHARWLVHVEPPKGRSVEHVAKYLARYVKRVAISDARLLEVTDATVTFQTKTGVVTLPGPEFVRRFALHILPKGFRKIRHSGLHAPGAAAKRLDLARALLPSETAAERPESADVHPEQEPATPKGETCPLCGEAAVYRIHHRPPPRSPAHARGPP